jgi:hypothetical protein
MADHRPDSGCPECSSKHVRRRPCGLVFQLFVLLFVIVAMVLNSYTIDNRLRELEQKAYRATNAVQYHEYMRHGHNKDGEFVWRIH